MILDDGLVVDGDLPDDDPDVAAGMIRLAELRALEHTVSDLPL